MLKDFKCDYLSKNAAGKPVFRIRWEWLTVEKKDFPSFQILYRSIREDEILKNSLFDSETIILYMRKEINIVGVEKCIKKDDRYTAKTYTLTPNATIFAEKEIEIHDPDCVYFFALVDKKGEIFEHQIKKAIVNISVPDCVIKSKSIWAKHQVIELSKMESRRIFLQTGDEGAFSYSLLPIGRSKYYINPNIRHVKLIYLSELINV